MKSPQIIAVSCAMVTSLGVERLGRRVHRISPSSPLPSRAGGYVARTPAGAQAAPVPSSSSSSQHRLSCKMMGACPDSLILYIGGTVAGCTLDELVLERRF
jgi:hypothetical protein